MIQLTFAVIAVFAIVLILFFAIGLFYNPHSISGEAILVSKNYYARSSGSSLYYRYELVVKGEFHGNVITESWEVDKKTFDLAKEGQEVFVQSNGELLVKLNKDD